MKHRKTPQQRKHEEYADYRYEAWHSVHGDRRARPLGKALDQRVRRRTVKQQLPPSSTPARQAIEGDCLSPIEPPPDPRLRRSSTATPLARHLESGRRRRAEASFHRFFFQRYGSKAVRIAFRKFLLDLLQTSSVEHARIIGRRMGLVCEPHSAPALVGYEAADARWLRAFFRDEPQLEPPTRQWIKETLGT